jgi:hypothetical protein
VIKQIKIKWKKKDKVEKIRWKKIKNLTLKIRLLRREANLKYGATD